MSHAHIKSSHGFTDGQLTIDGEDFGHPIRSIAYRLDLNTYAPILTVEFEVDHLTVDHQIPPPRDPDIAWHRNLEAALAAAANGESHAADLDYHDTTVRITVTPKAAASVIHTAGPTA